MTEQDFDKAKEILYKIEKVKKLESFVYNNPCIAESTGKSDYMYLSWVDNEDEDLKKAIMDWCNKEVTKLQEEFNKM